MAIKDPYIRQYTHFKNKPKEAIKYLRKVKRGVCTNAMYRKDIGYVDIIWGDETHGLKHIIDKHGNDIKKQGFKIETFIPIVFQCCSIKMQSENRYILECKLYKIVIVREYNGNKRAWLLTSFIKTR